MELLKDYFTALIDRVEASDIHNRGTDAGGFYKPTRIIILRNLNMLRDLHEKPRAREMCRSAWKSVVEELPPDWLILTPAQKLAIAAMLGEGQSGS